MAWVVDTCLVIDVLEGDARYGAASAACLDHHASAGLVLCPVSYVELAPAFLGDMQRQDEFLDRVGIGHQEAWIREDTVAAHRAWRRQVTSRRAHQGLRRPVADALIGGFAVRHGGLLTRNAAGFRSLFPSLRIAVPHGSH